MPDLSAARNTDGHSCPSFTGNTPHVGGPINTSSTDVLVEDLGAVRAGLDTAICAAGGPDKIAQGSAEVLVNDKNMARHTEQTSHAGTIVGHAATVIVGGATVTVVPIHLRSGESVSPPGKKGASGAGSHGPKEAGDPLEGVSSEDSAPLAAEEVDPIAAFEVFDVKTGLKVGGQRSFTALRCGEKYRFKSISFDPDDGNGTVADEGIQTWHWLVTADNGALGPTREFHSREFEIEIPQVDPARQNTSVAVGKLTVRLTVVDSDSKPRSSSTEDWMYVRPRYPCDSVKETKDKLDRIYGALKGMGYSWSADAYKRWLSGDGGEMIYDASWFLSFDRVRRSEESLNRKIAERLRPSILGRPIGVHSLFDRWAERFDLFDGVGAAWKGDDLASSWGRARILATVQCKLTVFADGTLTGIGVCAYEGQDSYDWNVDTGTNPLPAQVMWLSSELGWTDTDNLALEDCLQPPPRPFFQRARWTRGWSIEGKADFGLANGNLGLPASGKGMVIVGIRNFDIRPGPLEAR